MTGNTMFCKTVLTVYVSMLFLVFTIFLDFQNMCIFFKTFLVNIRD